MIPKLEFFNFGQEQNLDRHSCVEFHCDSYRDGFNFPKPQLNPQNAPLVPPKMEFFKFGLEPKVDHHSCVNFRSDSDGDGFKAQKPKMDLQIGPN